MKILVECLLVGLGGSLGALCRFGIAGLCNAYMKMSFPLGTLIANVTGCFLIGLFIGSGQDERSRQLKTFFGIGFLGALTTFSTFGAETVSQAGDGNTGIAITNVLLNLLLGIGAVLLGIIVGRRFQ